MSKFVNPIELKKEIEEKIESVQVDLSEVSSKAQQADKFTTFVFNKAHKCVFVFFIMLCALLGIPMACMNYLSSLGNPPNLSSITLPSNSITLMLLNLSNFSTLYYSQTNPYIQVFILLTLLIFSLALLLLAETWLKYIPKNYALKVTQIHSYSLQITVKDKIKRKDIKQFTQYLDTYTLKCIKWKIALLQSTQSKTHQERSLLNLLRQIAKKPTSIQDATPLPFRTVDLSLQLLDLREEHSSIIIAVFIYPEVAQVALQWWQNQENSESIKAHILDVKNAPSPRDLLFEKLQNKAQYKNKVASADRHVFLAILWEILFFLLFSAMVYLSTMPEMIFTPDFKTANEFLIRIGVLGAQSMLLFLHVKLFHQAFIPGCLLKSRPYILTFGEQAQKAIKWSIFLLTFDLFLLPTLAYIAVGFVSANFNFDNIKQIIEETLFGQYGISNLLVGYCAIKHILAPILKILFRLFRKIFSKCRRCTPYESEDEYLVAYTSLFLEFMILVCWSLISTPAIACLSLIGLLFKLEEFINLKTFKQTCLNAVCNYLQKLIFLIKYSFIAFGSIFIASLFNGYLIAIKPDFVNPLIIGLILSVVVLIISIFMDKVQPNAFQKPVYKIFDPLPEQIQSKMLYNPQEEEKYSGTKVVLDQMTKNIVQKVFPNQQILFNYNDELRENKAIFQNHTPELNRQDSAKKINQEMNTMSRSLEESLKNRLLAKPFNPFEIAPSTKEQEGEYSGIIYEDKVVMGPRKFKNVFIPLLELPYGQRRSQPQPQNLHIDPKSNSPLKRHNTGDTEQVSKLKPKRSYGSYNMTENETNSWGDTMVHANDIDDEEKKKKKMKENENAKKATEEREKKEQELAEELLQRKVKFTDLFDSDEESIKNLVKKKIKQSIPKLI